jgi:pseudouridine-5'-phosphate glycosidase
VTVSAEILKAVRNGDPVVALESTIITHGMPYPKNFDMSIKVERILRDKVLFKQYFKGLDYEFHVMFSHSGIWKKMKDAGYKLL